MLFPRIIAKEKMLRTFPPRHFHSGVRPFGRGSDARSDYRRLRPLAGRTARRSTVSTVPAIARVSHQNGITGISLSAASGIGMTCIVLSEGAVHEPGGGRFARDTKAFLECQNALSFCLARKRRL